MQVEVSLHMATFGKWWKPFFLHFLNSEIRFRDFGHRNYVRLVWLGLDLTVEW
jgi:hypothetical protein